MIFVLQNKGMNEKLQIRVLLVEDSATDALLLQEALSDIPGIEYAVTHVERLADCLARLREEKFDVVLLDLGLPDSRGAETFARLHQEEVSVPVLVLTGLDDESTGMKTLQEGAQDYLIKHQLQGSLLGRSIRYAIERHRLTTELRDSERRFRALIEHGADSVAVIDADNKIKYLSPAVTAVEGYSPEELLGQNGVENTHPDDLPMVQKIVQQLLANPGKSVPVLWRRRHKDGRWLWLEGVVTNLLGDPAVRGIVTNYRDITERKQAEAQLSASLKEKEVMLKEIHHRVKNNLQVITSLLNLQSKQISDPKVRDVFQESQQRVRAMALIHEELYRASNLAKIEMASYVRNLTTYLFQSYHGESQMVNMVINDGQVMLDIDHAIPCGLIINELVTNSLKYAFPRGTAMADGETTAEIRIDMRELEDNRILLRVSDNGSGLPAGLEFHNSATLGLQLVNTLTEQLRGNIELRNHKGTEFTITFASSKDKDKADGTSQNNGR